MSMAMRRFSWLASSIRGADHEGGGTPPASSSANGRDTLPRLEPAAPPSTTAGGPINQLSSEGLME